MKHYYNFNTYHHNRYDYSRMMVRETIPDVIFAKSADVKIKNTVGSRPAESYCLLLGYEEELNKDKIIVRDIIFDAGSPATRITCTLNTKILNPIIKEYAKKGLSVIGIDHSHPVSIDHPSGWDMDYFKSQLKKMYRKYFVVPITFTQPDGGFKQHVYVMTGPDSKAFPVSYKVVDDALLPPIPEIYATKAQPVAPSADVTAVDEKKNPVDVISAIGIQTSAEAPSKEAIKDAKAHLPADIDDRVKGAYDPDKARKATISGVGGGTELAKMYAHSGFKAVVLIDPDSVEDVNIRRQGFRLCDIGRKKVDALADYLREINPDINVITFPCKLEELTLEQCDLAFGDTDIAIFTTDSFKAQAYGNKLVLKYRINAIWAGFYKDSLAAEVVFYIPGVTPACFRCATSSRYEFQKKYEAENGKELSVSSRSNTIFHSAFLDSVIGMLTLAILNNDTEGMAYSHWFGSYWDRNLIQIKVNPAYSTGTFERTFAAAGDSAFLFETVWQRIERETPPKYASCPDCCRDVWDNDGHSDSITPNTNNKADMNTTELSTLNPKPGTSTPLITFTEDQTNVSHDDEGLNPGMFHVGEDLDPGTLHAGEDLDPGTLHAGEDLDPWTLHAGEDLDPGTLHAGEDLDPGTLHAGENLDPGTLHAGEDLDPGTLHAGEDLDPGTLHAGEDLDPGTLHAGEDLDPGTLHAGEDLDPGTLHAE